MKTIGLIPSRLASTRLPGKALAEIEGIPVVIHVAKRALLSQNLDSVLVCTDSHEIAEACSDYNIDFKITPSSFVNGTERIASVAKDLDADYFLDIQGDEPLLNPSHIDKVSYFLRSSSSSPDIVIPTLETSYSSPETIVRVQSSLTGRVMTLSRAQIPHRYSQSTSFIQKHLSVIGFTKSALIKFAQLPPSPYECIESVELLRALENDMKVYSLSVSGNSFSVDIEDDLSRARVAMKTDKFISLYK